MRKKGFFRRMEQNRKIQTIFCIVSVVIVVLLYFPLNIIVTQKAIIKREMSSDAQLYTDIIKINSKEGNISFYGQFLEKNLEVIDVAVVLKSQQDEEKVLKTILLSSEEVQQLAEQQDHDMVSNGMGFRASIKGEFLRDRSYEILINTIYKSDGEKVQKKVSTFRYFFNRDFYSYKPEELAIPKFSDKAMQEVVEKGNLLAYNQENGAWIYQFDDSLYWIFDTEKEWNRSEDLYVFLHIYAKDVMDLPEIRRQYGYDNQDFLLKSKEILVEGEEIQYRVAKANLLGEFPIAFISTGHYDSDIGSRWSSNFIWTPEDD